MAQVETKRYPFSNKGIVQKLDLNQLEDSQYAYLLNIVSQQEGSISPRQGYQHIGVQNWDYPILPPSLFHSMIVARSTSSSGPQVYLADGKILYRTGQITGSPSAGYNTPAAPNGSKRIAEEITSNGTRIGMAQFKTDQQNNTGTVYFATGYNLTTGTFRGMLRDNPNDNNAYARYNGILPPVVPAYIAPAAPTIEKVGSVTTAARVSPVPTVASIAARSENSLGLGNVNLGQQWTLGVSSLEGLQVGMYVEIGATPLKGRIQAIDVANTSINIALSGTPAIGNQIKSYETAITNVTGGGTLELSSFTADLSLSGNYQDGYDSDDFIHLSFYNDTPATLNTATLRLYAGAGQLGYYEYVITLAETAPFNDPSYPIAPYWIEYDIPKSSFTKNGVGSGDNSWANITVAQVTVRCFDPADLGGFKIGQIFGYGGGGPNSASSSSFIPYDYVYTYVDPQSGAESNPSQIMNPHNALYVSNQNISVICWGCDNTSANYNGGVTKIAIYRRGGSFTDGAFRRVGLMDNPGLSGGAPYAGTAAFIDTNDDASIVNAKQAEFDNDAPVTSDLNREYVGTLSTSYSNYVTITPTISGSPDLRTLMTPGTQVLIGGGVGDGSNQEWCTVWGITATSFKTFLVYSHVSGEQVTWSTRAGIAGDVIMAAMDCLWLAGNPDNPHILYRSKTGRPESWPVINDLTGNSHQLAISSPDNPINGLAEFNGEIVCLCRNGIYTVRLDSGVMRGPFKTPANRGLYQKYCWGYVDNAIWFLSYDGIYSWNGSTVTKKSLAVDFIFNGMTVNGIAPYDRLGSTNSAWPMLSNIQQRNNDVFFNYVATDSIFRVLRYNLIFDRWSLDQCYDINSTQPGSTTSITCLASDFSTGDLVCAKATSTLAGTLAYIGYYDQVGFYSDGGSTPQDGNSVPITYSAKSKAYDMGAAFTRKNFTDVAVELNSGLVSGSNTFGCKLYYDYSSTADATDTFTITPASTGRQNATLPLQQSGGASAGKEARVAQWEIYGTSFALNYWHGMAFGFIPLADNIKGRVTDWNDLGHPYDKRLKTITIEYDNGNSAVQVYLDTISGITGGTQSLATQTLTLPAATGRSKITLPVNDGIIAKMARLRPVVASSVYEIFDWRFDQDNYPPDRVFFTDWSDQGYEFEKRLYVLYINCDTAGQDVSVAIQGDGSTLQTVTVNGTGSDRMQPIALNPDLIAKLIRLSVSATAFSGNPNAKFQLFDYRFDYEQLPKPTVLSTPWTDLGYDYTKWCEQIAFDVNTNGYNVPVGIYCDGSLAQTVTVNGTQANRNQNITLNPGITFRQIRLQVNPASIPSGGRFQLWEYKPITTPADKGPVYHSFDWDDLGHPWDKKISEVTIEFETNSTDSNIQIAIDTLTGINGSTQNLSAIVLTLPNTSGGRGKKTFPLPETICKMVRIRSLGQSAGGTQSPNLKMWGYKFGNTIPYPADTSLFTEWTDNGYPCAKIFRGVGLQVDTGGVACTVTLEMDGASQTSWTINTTSANRQVYLSPPNGTEINGYLFRVTFTPGGGGKAQLFGNPEWNLPKDACDYTAWDSYAQAFGSAGYTIIKQIWCDYKCAGTVTLTLYNELNEILMTKQLPAHATRAVERFYVPSIGTTGVLNKSKKHRIVLTADTPTLRFRLYRDSSRTEYINLSADQRKGYYQQIYWSDIVIPI